MRVAMVAPVEIRVPPVGYGGTELVVSLLTEELVRRGHDVTLFASGDSATNAKLVSVCDKFVRGSGRDGGILTILNVRTSLISSTTTPALKACLRQDWSVPLCSQRSMEAWLGTGSSSSSTIEDGGIR